MGDKSMSFFQLALQDRYHPTWPVALVDAHFAPEYRICGHEIFPIWTSPRLSEYGVSSRHTSYGPGACSMSWFYQLSLIHLFGFYLAVAFLLSTFLRLRQYGQVLALVGRFRGRWPNLLNLLRQHVTLLLGRGTVIPLLIMLGLLLANSIASNWIWPQARHFHLGDLLQLWPVVPVVGLIGAAMLAFDLWGIFWVSEIDRAGMEKYFDQAEYWLQGWKAPIVRAITLGFVNPRKMVAAEVRSSLESASQMLNYTMWWVSIQAGLRIAFGLSLWGSFALHGPIRRMIGSD
jgi:hypothetical protein